MNTSVTICWNSPKRKLLPALIAAAALLLGATASQAAPTPKVLPPAPHVYSALSAHWWQWALSRPVTGHPFNDDPAFDVASGQHGPLWFLATPFGTVERDVTIPCGRSLFIGLLNAEASDLEGLGATESERRETARFLADHIQNVTCAIDGVAVPRLERYRFTSPQFSFEAPSPWIFGETGGSGTAVADGYFLLLAPLARGAHTIRIRGNFHFAVAEGDPFDLDAAADVTYRIRMQ